MPGAPEATISRRTLLIAAACCVTLTIGTGVVDAATYRAARVDTTILRIDAGFDSNDRPAQGWIDPDIRVTTRIISAEENGRRWLIIRFRTYDYLQAYWTVLARLDVRGGPETDAKMSISDDGAGTFGCRFKGSRTGWRVAKFRFLGEVAAQVGAQCKVPMGWVHATRSIRWKLFSPKSLEAGRRVDEYAPDHGWYA